MHGIPDASSLLSLVSPPPAPIEGREAGAMPEGLGHLTGLLAAAEAGATAVIQPGGSIRDEEVIKAADKAGLAMVFTGMRHFRH